MKVLVISYAPLTLSNNGGKYIISLLESFKKEELMQFYVCNMSPDIDKCETYYRQTDIEIIGQILGKKYNHITENKDLASKKVDYNQITIDGSKNRTLKLILRDLLWGTDKWYTKELKQWIEDEKPECILATSGDSCFLYKLSMRIASDYELPLIGVFGDDYYSIDDSNMGFIKRIQCRKLKKIIEKYVASCDSVITINKRFAAYYNEIFNEKSTKKIISVCTGSSFDFTESARALPDNYNLKISYIGNLSVGRSENLIELGQMIDKYNSAHCTNHILQFYGKDSNDFVKKTTDIKALKYMGFIAGTEVRNAILGSDILVHVESFKEEFIEKTKFSLSTKIADSLNSGRCVLAYGPDSVASMQHLIENKCAWFLGDKNDAYNNLETLLSDRQLIFDLGKRGKIVAEKYHNKEKNGKIVFDLICSIVDDNIRKRSYEKSGLDSLEI